MRRARRGMSLMEVVVGALVLSFILAAMTALFLAGHKQQSRGRYYSQVQTDMRTALRTATRTIRHGYKAVVGSTMSNFPSGARDSSSSQVIVQVPESSSSTNSTAEIRFYVSGTTLYAQRSDESTPGTTLITDVSSLTINYFRTVSGTRTSVDSSPATATEVRLTLSTTYGTVTSTTAAYATLRNAISSL